MGRSLRRAHSSAVHIRIVAGKPLIRQRREPAKLAGGLWSRSMLRFVAMFAVSAVVLLMDDNPEDEGTMVIVDHIIP
jgi:hypothetical protein